IAPATAASASSSRSTPVGSTTTPCSVAASGPNGTRTRSSVSVGPLIVASVPSARTSRPRAHAPAASTLTRQTRRTRPPNRTLRLHAVQPELRHARAERQPLQGERLDARLHRLREPVRLERDAGPAAGALAVHTNTPLPRRRAARRRQGGQHGDGDRGSRSA